MKISLGELRAVIRESINESLDEAGLGRKIAAGFALGAALGGTAGYQAGKQPTPGKTDHYAQELQGPKVSEISAIIADSNEETAGVWLDAMINPTNRQVSKDLNSLADEVEAGSPQKVLLHILNRDPKLFMKHWKMSGNK